MSDQRRPNILLIYPDQLRADAMGCAGNPVVKTPNFNRLALEGVRFANAYTSYPLCCPFRASVVTGKYAHANGMYCNHLPIDTNQTFLAPLLKDVGYRTAFFGKWHLDGGPHPGFVPPGERRLGFDHFVGFNRGHHYLQSIFYEDSDQPLHCPRFEPDYQTDHLLDYLKTRKGQGGDNPFFAYLCYGAPHYPNTMPPYYETLYSPEQVILPPGTPDPDLQLATQKWKLEVNCAGDMAAMDKSKAAKGKGPYDPETEEEVRRFIAQYYGMVTNIDHNVGRILNFLDASGMAENTVVILMSDHGDMFGQHGSFCGMKRSYYKASMQVPLIVRYPKRFAPGRTLDGLVDVGVDTMPTLLELCGIDIPDAVQGISYLSMLDGTADRSRDAVMYEIIKQISGKGAGGYMPVPERGIRTEKWLYVRKKDRPICLIDLENDPDELNNLIGGAAYAQVVAELDAAIDTHMAATGDDWGIEADWPPPDMIAKADVKNLIENVLLKTAIVRP